MWRRVVESAEALLSHSDYGRRRVLGPYFRAAGALAVRSGTQTCVVRLRRPVRPSAIAQTGTSAPCRAPRAACRRAVVRTARMARDVIRAMRIGASLPGAPKAKPRARGSCVPSTSPRPYPHQPPRRCPRRTPAVALRARARALEACEHEQSRVGQYDPPVVSARKTRRPEVALCATTLRAVVSAVIIDVHPIAVHGAGGGCSGENRCRSSPSARGQCTGRPG